MPDRKIVAMVMSHIHHYFEASCLQGDFTITGGRLNAVVKPHEWVALAGAGTAAGVYLSDENGLLPEVKDTAFSGSVWFLAPPADFLSLCDEIEAWQCKHPHTACASQTIGDYSRTLATGSGGAPLTWAEVFAGELNRWRRMFMEVKV